MAIDWRDPHDTLDQVQIEMLDPANFNHSRGFLEGVDLSKSKVTCSYYSDTRTSATIAVVGDGYIRGSALRIWYRIPEWDYERCLGTYFVIKDKPNQQNGVWHYSLECHSVLYGMAQYKASVSWTIAKQARMLKAAEQMANTTKISLLTSNANDYVFSSARTLAGGESFLSRFYALTDVSNNRLDVDGKGNVIIEKYVLPKNKPSVYEFDTSDPRGIVFDGTTLENNYLSMPGEAAVRHVYTTTQNGKSVEKEITAYAQATGDSSKAVRGFMVTDLHEVNDLSPRTQARALQLAKQYLEKDQVEGIEWQIKTKYVPIWEGDVVTLIITNGLERYQGKRKCLVKSLDLELDHMNLSLTLKETSSVSGQNDEVN